MIEETQQFLNGTMGPDAPRVTEKHLRDTMEETASAAVLDELVASTNHDVGHQRKHLCWAIYVACNDSGNPMVRVGLFAQTGVSVDSEYGYADLAYIAARTAHDGLQDYTRYLGNARLHEADHPDYFKPVLEFLDLVGSEHIREV